MKHLLEQASEYLVGETLKQFAKRFKARIRTFTPAAVPRLPEAGEAIAKVLTRVPGSNFVPSVDAVVAMAESVWNRVAGPNFSDLDLSQICRQLNLNDAKSHGDAESLAKAWLDGTGARDLDKRSGEDMIKLLAAAVVAAVLLLVIAARRQSPGEEGTRRLFVSSDFALLQRIRSQSLPGSNTAGMLIETSDDPGSFSLTASLAELDETSRRELLSTLQAALHDKRVSLIEPTPGDKFDETCMESNPVRKTSSQWVVRTSCKQRGFRFEGKPLCKAKVDICTADWWSLALAQPDCPVGQYVRNAPETYLDLQPDRVYGWSVRDGFSSFGDLRQTFDESTLSQWAERFARDLTAYYASLPQQHPNRFGSAGERFDISRMRSVNGLPVGGAIVKRVVERDGLPQLGFGCEKASPLLLAIVEMEER